MTSAGEIWKSNWNSHIKINANTWRTEVSINAEHTKNIFWPNDYILSHVLNINIQINSPRGTKNIHISTTCNSSSLEITQLSINHWMANNLWYIHSVELLSIENEWPHHYMNKTGKRNVERKKLDTKEHMLYGSIYFVFKNKQHWSVWSQDRGYLGQRVASRRHEGFRVASTVLFLVLGARAQLCLFCENSLRLVHFSLCMLHFNKKITLKWSLFFEMIEMITMVVSRLWEKNV